MKFLDKHFDALRDALSSLRPSCGGEFFLDDVCWDNDGYTAVSLAYWEPPVNYYQTLRVFDLRSPEWTPALLLLACLRLIFPERDCVALVNLRNKLFNQYFK